MDALIGGTAITIGSSGSDHILGRKAVTKAGVGATLEAHGVGVGNPIVGFAHAGNVGERRDDRSSVGFCLSGAIGIGRSLQEQRQI